MPPIVARIVASLGLIALAPLAYIFLFVLIEFVVHADRTALTVTTAILGPLFVLAWMRIWREQVLWNRRRCIHTLVAALLAIGVGVAFYVLPVVVGSALRRHVDDKLALVLGTGCFAAAWIVFSSWAWRETRMERDMRLRIGKSVDMRCPKCGYNLHGLHEVRCPECGTQYTLDEIVAEILARSDAGLHE